jgi:membrane-bound metal-dependent hydrolase YbcI (DUF457 family)
MRTGFGEHLLAAVVIFVILLLLSGISPSIELPLGGTFFILGALMPDLDSPASKPRKFMSKVIFILALAILLLFYPQLSALCGGFAEPICEYLPLLSILLVFTAVYIANLMIPRHRGFLHSFPAAVLYGVAVCLLMLFLGIGDPFRIGAWAFGGYLSHLAVDFIGDAIPFK